MSPGRALALAILLLATSILSAADAAQAGRIVLREDFSEPAVRALPSGLVAIEAEGCATLAQPGLPLLPARGVVVVIPPGETLDRVTASPGGARALPGTLRLGWGQTPQPTSVLGPVSPTEPDPSVYGSSADYPPSHAILVTEQIAWGHRLAFVRVMPVTWNPSTGQARWHPSVEITVETRPLDPAAAEGQARMVRRTPEVLARLTSLVTNDEGLATYQDPPARHGTWGRVEPDDYPYVIITSEAHRAWFGEIAAYESSRGLRARIVTCEEIDASYAGIDLPERIRAFVIDAYANWGTEYVLLGGDVDVVPVRNLYVDAGGTIDQFPGDCYYEALDGNWNADGDELWGEWDEFDLAGELAVGRVTAHDPAQLAAWFRKNRMYAEEPVVSEVQKALFLGERMDDVPTYACGYMDRVKDYSCDFGYCTSGYPNTFTKGMLCDSDGYGWTGMDAIQAFNQGFMSSHHLGHANTTYTMKFSNPDIVYFTNDGVSHSFTFISTQGCYSNNFDAVGTDAIAEVLVLDDNAASAFLGNTRYGWYCPGWYTGPSQHYDRELVDARYGEGIATIGNMNVDSKTDNIWQIDPWNLWCHYELCILGDPAMPQWSRLAGDLHVEHAGTYVMGQGAYTVRVTAGGLPLRDASVAIWSDDLSVNVHGMTDAQGYVNLTPDPAYPAPMHVKAVKTDYLPGTGVIEVDPGAQPWLVWHATVLDDDGEAPSMGDGDGQADLGESIQMMIGLENIGHLAAEGVTAAIACEDPLVAIGDAAAAYGAIPAGATGSNQDDFIVSVLHGIADGQTVGFTIDAENAQGQQWHERFEIVLHRPILSLQSWWIDDTGIGDGQGDIDPGEQFRVRMVLANSGSDAARDYGATLASASPWIEILDGASGAPSVPAGGVAELAPPFRAALAPDTPTEGFVDFSMNGQTWCGQTFAADIRVRIASYYESIFEDDAGWTAGGAGDDATQGAWTRVDPLGTYRFGAPVQPEDDHSEDGIACFVTGQGTPGQNANLSDVDGGRTTLRSPAIDLRWAVDPRLVYWRWYTNNQGSFPGQDTWTVEISDDDGATWVTLESTNSSENSWRRMEFRLLDYIEQTDRVRIRFIASDYGYDSLVEAAVDDVSIESLPRDPAAADGWPGAVRFGLDPIVPNPCNASAGGARVRLSIPQAGRVTLGVYDVRGALVRAIMDAPVGGAGVVDLIFDGRDAHGRALPSGMYFVKLHGPGGGTAIRQVAIVR